MLNAKFYQKYLLSNTKEDGMLIVFLDKKNFLRADSSHKF